MDIPESIKKTNPIIVGEKCKIKYESLGVAASIVIITAWIPQIVQLLSTQDISGLNEWLFLLTGVGNASLAVYGGLNQSIAIIVTGTLVATAAFLVFISILVIRHLHSSSSATSATPS